MERKTSIKGHHVVYGIPALMRVSYFRYGSMYPSHAQWLANFFLVGGNGFQYDGEHWYCYHTKEAIIAATGKRIPSGWFNEVKQPIRLYPFVYPDCCLLGYIRNGEITLTDELRTLLEQFLTYLTACKTTMMFYEENDTSAKTIEFIRGILNA